MSSLFDYEIIEQLHSGPRSQVWRARAADGAALVVKVPNQQFLSFQQLTSFKREYAAARRCRHPGVVQPLALQRHGGRWTMLLEDSGGTALDALLREQLTLRGAPSQPVLALDDFFEIALQLCAALEAVHLQGMVHRDINPSNLVWNGQRRLLQLIDFGIACELPPASCTEHADHGGHTPEGTLRYMAPEQTGRMNRRIDYRADFYALGATFYELLSGHARLRPTTRWNWCIATWRAARTGRIRRWPPCRDSCCRSYSACWKKSRAALPEPARLARRPGRLPCAAACPTTHAVGP